MIASAARPDVNVDPPDDDDPADIDDLGIVIGASLEVFEDHGPGELANRNLDGRTHDGLTDAAERCMVRFAGLEADVTSAELTGPGRLSPVRFPRLGGVLHGRVGAGSREARALVIGVERTISVGYQTALATPQVAAAPVRHVAVDELWEAFVPASYRIPRDVASIAWSVCRFDTFWTSLLADLGLDGDANRFGNGHVSPLSRSIRGLSTVGVALGLTERGGRHDRLWSSGRTLRTPRRKGRAMPPAPQVVDDDTT